MALCVDELFRVALPKSLHKINKAGKGIKEKQYEALWSVVKDKNDTICVLSTGLWKVGACLTVINIVKTMIYLQ